MTWAAVQLRAQILATPRWLEAWRVRRARRALGAVCPTSIPQTRRLYVDVAVISKHDAGTGIQRIVRAVAAQLLAEPPDGWEVVAVSANRKRPYHPISWPDGAGAMARSTPIGGRPGDVFLGLDFSLDTVHQHRSQLAAFKRAGGQLWFVMYDLLPAQRPDWFSDKLIVRYRRWLGTLAALADGFHCISTPVQSELRDELTKSYGLERGFRTHVVPMGWDVESSRPSSGVAPGFDALLPAFSKKPTALMVGTLEPRKGHADVLAAFDLLWAQGMPYQLVLVGRPGWKTESLQQTLREHPESGKRLFWFDEASDEALTKLYSVCSGVIAASFAEGYGLPLIEALGHGKPVLARDLPVFRLHEAMSVQYFAADAEPAQLADHIRTWFAAGPAAPGPAASQIATWSDTAKSIVRVLAQEHN